MAASWRVRLFILSAVVLLQAGLGTYWPVLYAIRSRALEPFKAHLAEYLAPVNGPPASAPVKGKMVVVDKASRDIDWDVFFALPDGLRAETPEQAGAAAVLLYDRVKDDHFAYGQQRFPAYRQTCAVAVIDLASHRAIAITFLTGGDPPDEIDEHATEGVGPRPTKEVVHYLESLPRS